MIKKILRGTAFYAIQQKYKQRKISKQQQRLEQRILPERIKFYKQFIQPSDLVFDVGANIGNRVEAFLQCKAKVVAVEPQPKCVEILKRSFGETITVEMLGLSDKPGELEMHLSTDSTVSSFSNDFISRTKDRFKYSKWEDTIRVPVTTLDHLIAKHGCPKFCKIDVEGFELQVLKGLTEIIPYISIEYCVPEMQAQNLECLQYLNFLNPRAQYNYSVGESMNWEMENWMKFDDFIAYVKSRIFIDSSFGDIYIKNG